MTVSGTKTALSQRLKYNQNSQKMMEPGMHILSVKKLLESNPILKHKRTRAHSMTMSSMSTGDVIGKTVAVPLLLATQTGTRATGTNSVLINPLNLMISMGILSVSNRTHYQIATKTTLMVYITTVIGTTLAVNNSGKIKVGMIASGMALVILQMKKKLVKYPSLTG